MNSPREGAGASAPRSVRSRSAGGKPRPKLVRPSGPPPSCPRCQADSENTKFCYYNNYNVNQPRYYCKACQRHWTAGGTLRKVESGAGKRNNRRQRSLGPGGKGRSGTEGLEAHSTISPGAGSEQDPASYMLHAGDSKAGTLSWSNAAGRTPEAFMVTSNASPMPAFDQGGLPWPKGFASAELPDEMVLNSADGTLKVQASQALLDMDTVLTDEALDAMFAPAGAGASASAPAQVVSGAPWASSSAPAHQLSTRSDSQAQLARGRGALVHNWSECTQVGGSAMAAKGGTIGLPPTSAALRTHMTSGPPPMVASSYPAAPQVFDAAPEAMPAGIRTQQAAPRAPAWVHSASTEQRPGSSKRDSRGEVKPSGGSSNGDHAVGQEAGGHTAVAAQPMLPQGWLPLDHPGAEAQRLRAAHAARDAALQMQRQAAVVFPPSAPYMPMGMPQAYGMAQRPHVPGSYSCPPQGAVNMNSAGLRPQFAASTGVSNAPNWQHVGINSSSVSTQSQMAQQEGFNAAFDHAMAAAAHPTSPPLKKAASASASGAHAGQYPAATAPMMASLPPQQ